MRIQNSELKTQLSIIKSKISEIKSKLNYNNNFRKPNSILHAEYTNKYLPNKNETIQNIDYEIREVQKKIKYYEEEIIKKKYQSDNIYPITKFNLLKNELLEESKKIKNIKEENKNLKTLYNSQIKDMDELELEMNIKTNEDKNKEKISKIKIEIKQKQKNFNELTNKLKEQRFGYSNLMNEINSIKNKIKEVKGMKNTDIKKVNYDEEISKEEKNILEEEKKIKEEEIEYKNTFIKNEREINRLTILIGEKRILLKNKGDDIRKSQISLKKRKNSGDSKEKSKKTEKVNDINDIKNISKANSKEKKKSLKKKEIEEENKNINKEYENGNSYKGFFVTEDANKKENINKKNNIKENKNKEEIIYKNINIKKEDSKNKDNSENIENDDNNENEDITDKNVDNEQNENEKIDVEDNIHYSINKEKNDYNSRFENDLNDLSSFIISERKGLMVDKKPKINKNKKNSEKEINTVKSNNFINDED